MVVGFARYSKKYKTQVRYTLKNHRAFIRKGIQNSWAFKVVIVHSVVDLLLIFFSQLTDCTKNEPLLQQTFFNLRHFSRFSGTKKGTALSKLFGQRGTARKLLER